MSSIILDAATERDIDDRVARILSDLGNPGPPLPLAEVRELLSLDRAFYTSSDTDVLKETIHRLKVAGKQVLLRPSLLIDVVRKLELKALWIPDRKRILIDRELHQARQRWGEAHEIGHSLIPWHDQMLHGDPQRTLQQACELRLEAEANYAAGRLLFLRGQFRERLLSDPASLESIRDLAKVFGNSVTATLWRAVEVLDRPASALISQHPRDPIPPPTRLRSGTSSGHETSRSSILASRATTSLHDSAGSAPAGTAPSARMRLSSTMRWASPTRFSSSAFTIATTPSRSGSDAVPSQAQRSYCPRKQWTPGDDPGPRTYPTEPPAAGR